MADLHSALKTRVLGTAGAGVSGLQLALVHNQYGKTSEQLVLHASPMMWEGVGPTRAE